MVIEKGGEGVWKDCFIYEKDSVSAKMLTRHALAKFYQKWLGSF